MPSTSKILNFNLPLQMDHSLILYPAFAKWVDDSLSSNIPKGIRAFNFNLYETADSYEVELIGADRFDVSDSDWACHDVFNTGDLLFEIPKGEAGTRWEDGYEYAVELVMTYLENGKKSGLLLSSEAVGIGFVDGDLELLWMKGMKI
jgi:hypothetical protein